jgi:hypothetical protein
MENISASKRRVFRSKSMILELLEEQRKSGLSIQAFCNRHGIASASFHNWKKKFSAVDLSSTVPGFTPLQIRAASASLFAEVNGIRLYQPVSAGYLKELAS